jgi:cytoskeletal protein CcmA (bactofilin family)
VQEALRPTAQAPQVVIEQRRVQCFDCGAEFEAPRAAASTMCKRCSSYVDLSDHRIIQTVSKNFRTHGRLVVEEKGFLLNTNALAAEAVIKGRLIGKLATRGILELHSSARIQGSFTAGQLVIPATCRFYWAECLQVGNAEISGELVASLRASGTVRVRSTARYFGSIQAANLVIEPGAVFVGNVQISPPPAPNPVL